MKFVVAKCPNCGAQIEVDKNSDSTRCEYCNSKIIVEEVLGNNKFNKIQINNLPKFENYLILGDRNYNDKNYAEAYKYYEKALELDPQNENVILKHGFSKTLSAKFSDTDVKSSINALKNAGVIMKKENAQEKYEQAVLECKNIINETYNKLLNYYKSVGLKKDEVQFFNYKLQECLNGYEYLYSIAKYDELKIDLLERIIKTIDNIISSKVFLTGQMMSSGVPTKAFYHMSSPSVAKFKTARQKYVRELNELKNSISKQQVGNKTDNNIKEGFMNHINNFTKMNIIKKISFLVGILFMFVGLLAFFNGHFFTYLFWAATGLLFIPEIKERLVKKLEKKIKDADLLITAIKIFLVFMSLIVLVVAIGLETKK